MTCIIRVVALIRDLNPSNTSRFVRQIHLGLYNKMIIKLIASGSYFTKREAETIFLKAQIYVIFRFEANPSGIDAAILQIEHLKHRVIDQTVIIDS